MRSALSINGRDVCDAIPDSADDAFDVDGFEAEEFTAPEIALPRGRGKAVAAFVIAQFEADYATDHIPDSDPDNGDES